jgi:hypothetical protein
MTTMALAGLSSAHAASVALLTPSCCASTVAGQAHAQGQAHTNNPTLAVTKKTAAVTCAQTVPHQQQLIARSLVQEAPHTRQLVGGKPLRSLQGTNNRLRHCMTLVAVTRMHTPRPYLCRPCQLSAVLLTWGLSYMHKLCSITCICDLASVCVMRFPAQECWQIHAAGC